MLITLVAGKGGYPLALIVSAIGTSAGALILAFMPRYPTGRNDASYATRPAGPQVIPASNESST
jgi:hypothetical protein